MFVCVCHRRKSDGDDGDVPCLTGHIPKAVFGPENLEKAPHNEAKVVHQEVGITTVWPAVSMVLSKHWDHGFKFILKLMSEYIK